jgi:hypothetical protein
LKPVVEFEVDAFISHGSMNIMSARLQMGKNWLGEIIFAENC